MNDRLSGKELFIRFTASAFRKLLSVYVFSYHSVLTICTQTGTCDTRSGVLVFFSAAFDEFPEELILL